MPLLFYQFYQPLAAKNARVTVELKNDFTVEGTLVFVDQQMNVSLKDIRIEDPETYPYLLAIKNIFLRGSIIRYMHMNPADIDTKELEEASAREAEAED